MPLGGRQASGHLFNSRSYTPGAYNSFYIHEPKRRLISAVEAKSAGLIPGRGMACHARPKIKAPHLFQ